MGVHSPALTAPLAEVLRLLGRQAAWVVHGAGGMDELSTLGATQFSRFDTPGDAISHGAILPEDAGLPRVADLDGLRGGTAEENARTLLGVLSGEIAGPRLDLVLLNAAAGLAAAGVCGPLPEGVQLARAQIVNGHALAKLKALAAFA
jgi:anthranilate phosphoribosyltransferase